jgi:hypothetical protein
MCSGGQRARAVRAWNVVPSLWDCGHQYQAEQASRLPPATTQMRQEMIFLPCIAHIGGYFGLNRLERRGTQQTRAIAVHGREACDWIIGKGKLGRVNQVPEVPAINAGHRNREQLRWRLLVTVVAVLTDQYPFQRVDDPVVDGLTRGAILTQCVEDVTNGGSTGKPKWRVRFSRVNGGAGNPRYILVAQTKPAE